ncbi:MAG: F-type H+-transporting ATPase delta subunit AtpH [Rhodobacteraceae bacterium HLUCCA08]|nr:MAG: F-type H+-transporting ATPase delta subunit AtpH [Rhodobacteraceae bacterium HLUCCA08]
MDVSEPASISSGIAQRYATAVFDLAREDKGLAALEQDIAALNGALDASADLRALIASPVYTRADQEAAITAVARKAGLSAMVTSTLGLMAQKRRLFVLPQMLRALADRIAAEKGEITAEVVSAKALTKAQSDKLAKTLKERIGKEINLNATVDESLIGGLVVKVGSTMIDTSVASKLNALKNTMKEAR